MNEELLKRFKRKIPLLNELEEKYSGGDPAKKSDWVNQKDYRSSIDQENINKAYCFYAYPKFAMNKYKTSELEWLISKGFLGYDELVEASSRCDPDKDTLLQWFLRYIDPEINEDREVRMKANKIIFDNFLNRLPVIGRR